MVSLISGVFAGMIFVYLFAGQHAGAPIVATFHSHPENVVQPGARRNGVCCTEEVYEEGADAENGA